MRDRNAGDAPVAPIADVLVACQAAYDALQDEPSYFTDTATLHHTTLSDAFPRLRAELERLDVGNRAYVELVERIEQQIRTLELHLGALANADPATKTDMELSVAMLRALLSPPKEK